MALFSGTRGFIFGFSIGCGVGFFSRELIPIVRDFTRPASKTILRSGLLVIEKAREGIAKLGETIEDLAAEVNAELQHQKATAMHAKHSHKKSHKKSHKPRTTKPVDSTETSHERKTA